MRDAWRCVGFPASTSGSARTPSAISPRGRCRLCPVASARSSAHARSCVRRILRARSATPARSHGRRPNARRHARPHGRRRCAYPPAIGRPRARRRRGDRRSRAHVRATRLLAEARARQGLGDTLLHRGEPIEALLASDSALRVAVERDLVRIYDRGRDLIRERRDAVLVIADRLQARRCLTGAEAEAALLRPNGP